MRKNFVQTVEITPKEFEIQVKDWLQRNSDELMNFRITNLKKVEGAGGEYEIDAVAEFEVLGGASIIVLVECKYYKSPIKRDTIMILDAKVRDTGSHKGIIFTTSSFQSGALKYAEKNGIATVIVQDGQAAYETKSFSTNSTPPSWYPNYKYIGWMTTINEEGNESHHLIADDYKDAIEKWLK